MSVLPTGLFPQQNYLSHRLRGDYEHQLDDMERRLIIHQGDHYHCFSSDVILFRITAAHCNISFRSLNKYMYEWICLEIVENIKLSKKMRFSDIKLYIKFPGEPQNWLNTNMPIPRAAVQKKNCAVSLEVSAVRICWDRESMSSPGVDLPWRREQ